MICPVDNTQMNHLNKGDWHSGSDSYATYDYLQCPTCKRIAIEHYHTEFIKEDSTELPVPEFNLLYKD